MTSEQIALLLQRPTESINLEVKTWLDLRGDDAAKLVKGLFALRNRNGGTFVIGFNDKTLQPDPYGLPDPVATVYHPDKVQELVSRFANVPFAVAVDMGSVNGLDHPVITVPSGVQVPVVVKRDLFAPEDAKRQRKLLAEGDVYFRTLGSNGRVSSSLMKLGDWSDLLDICFDNREADIGRFLRRHVGQEHLALLSGQPDPPPGLEQRCQALMQDGTAAADVAFAEAAASDANAVRPDWIPAHPLTMSVALCLDPPHEGLPTVAFLAAVFAANPNYTPRAMWRDTRASMRRGSHPVVKNGRWQATEVFYDRAFPHSQFDAMSPRGEFFTKRLMQDDLREGMTTPGLHLDVVLMILRVTEIFAVGLAIAKATGWTGGDNAGFAFRWTGLAGRSLAAWAKPFEWETGAHGKAHDAHADSYVGLPIDTPVTSLAPHVSRAVGPLFAKFDGYEPASRLVETCVRMLADRQAG